MGALGAGPVVLYLVTYPYVDADPVLLPDGNLRVFLCQIFLVVGFFK
jgi:hypothetical protein